MGHGWGGAAWFSWGCSMELSLRKKAKWAENSLFIPIIDHGNTI